MQKQLLNRTTQSVMAAPPECFLSSLLQSTPPAKHRRLRNVPSASPRRQPCLAHRVVLAAERAAELAFWQVTGGDFLRSSVSTEFIRTWHP